jgi:streptogramin lyase
MSSDPISAKPEEPRNPSLDGPVANTNTPSVPYIPTSLPNVPDAKVAVVVPVETTKEAAIFGQGGTGFNVKNPPDGPVSSGVGLDKDGALIVDYANHAGQNLIWVPHTETQMVSKIDTSTMKELARYRVGSEDPSRTSVAPDGSAYVASRETAGITKVSALGQNCPDTNGDGVVTTSKGPDDVLPYGKDDCVLWYTDIKPYQAHSKRHMLRGVAVQVVPGKMVNVKGADGQNKVTWMPPKEYVWTGGTQAFRLHKLDGDTGKVLLTMEVPIRIYGMALDGRDRQEMPGPYLWLTGGHGGHNLAHVDTSRCVDQASCMKEPVCVVNCSESNCKSTCDNAIVAHYMLDPAHAYGITVDCKQRVWLGSRSALGVSNVKRYDPFAPPDKRLKLVPNTPITHGIAADGKGFVWGAFADDGIIYKINGETLKVVNLTVPTKGIGVDRAGLIWSIPNDKSNELHVVEPTNDLSGSDKIRMSVVTLTGNPYVYSDMTGQQLILASNEPGYYRQVFGPCEGERVETRWQSFEWSAELPAETNVIISFRTADSRAGLTNAVWVTIPVTASNLEGSNDLEGILANSGKGNFLEIQAQLFPQAGGSKSNACFSGSVSGATPRVKKLGAKKICIPPPLPPPPDIVIL